MKRTPKPDLVAQSLARASEHARLLEVAGEVLDALPGYAFLVDPEGVLLAANRAARTDFRLADEGFVGRALFEALVELQPPIGVRSPGEAGESDHFDTVRHRWLRAHKSASPLFVADGQPLYLYTTRDVSADVKSDELILRRNFETQRVIAAILRLSLEDLPLEKLLEGILREIVSLEWLAHEEKSCILLVDGQPNVLQMKASTNLHPAQAAACANVPFGRCLCGRAAATGETIFAARVDGHHDIEYEGMPEHGHYCTPIRFAGETLGVVTTYLAPGHEDSSREREYLAAIADTVAGILVRRRSEADRAELNKRYLHAQKMEAVGRLAGGVAHDFNNLLSVILGYLSILKEEFLPTDKALEDLGEAQHAAMRAAALTRQLLAFSRTEISRPVVLSPNEVVESMERMLRRIIGEDVVLETRLSPAAPMIRIDRSLLEQTLVNLVLNARDAMPDGGRIVIETSLCADETDAAGAESAGSTTDRLCLRVADTGIGMPPEVLDRIFEPFFTTKEVGKGTGLGLATVYGTVKQALGDIRVTSQVGEGSEFTILVPAVSEDEEVASQSRFRSELAPRSATVLLVEDDDAVRGIARRLLTRGGYDVLEAPSASDALIISRGYSGEIDLLLSDVVMPGLGGRSLVRLLSQERPGMKTLLMSGHAESFLAERGPIDTDAPFLRKPFTEESLLRAVARLLR